LGKRKPTKTPISIGAWNVGGRPNDSKKTTIGGADGLLVMEIGTGIYIRRRTIEYNTQIHKTHYCNKNKRNE
jgi:hypothetical protein